MKQRKPYIRLFDVVNRNLCSGINWSFLKRPVLRFTGLYVIINLRDGEVFA